VAVSFPLSGLQLHSLIKKSGELEVSLATVEVPSPAPNEVVVRIEASPINPSDIGLLFGPQTCPLRVKQVRWNAQSSWLAYPRQPWPR